MSFMSAAAGTVPVRRAGHQTRHISPMLWILIAVVAALPFAGFAALLHHTGTVFHTDDAVGYYVYLRSIVHDGDLDFTNDYRFFGITDGAPGSNLGHRDPVTGRPNNNYTVGFPLMVAPFYLVGNVLFARYYGGGEAAFPLFLDQLIFSYSSLLLGCVGMWLSFKFVSLYFAERDSFLATVVFWLCSPLIYYFSREPFQSHLASVLAVSLLLYLWQAPSLAVNIRLVLMGMAAGLVAMVRQQDLVVLLLPAGSALLARQVSLDRVWRIAGLQIPLFVAGFAPVFAVQMVAWRILRGSFLSYAYPGQGFAYAARPKIVEVLLSSNHGLISWHPVILLCLVGLVVLSRSAGALGWLALACFGAQLYVSASWWCWWMGYSFGHRAFLGLTPLFILGLAAVCARLTRPRLRYLFLGVVVLLFLWNLTLMFAYLSEMIPYQGEFSWTGLIRRLPQLPSHVLSKLRRV
jgi:hypothetical protein